MSEFVLSKPHGRRRKPIAACIAALFALSAPAAMATTWPVTSCAESGPGSLRDVVGAPTTVSFDVVDLSALSCADSTISLTTGEIVINQDFLTIQGPGASALSISGQDNFAVEHYRIFEHKGTGTLTVAGLGLKDAKDLPLSGNPAFGGCIASAHNVNLIGVDLHNCTAYATGTAGAAGGGVFVAGNLVMKYSTLTGNTASSVQGYSVGGGVHAVHDVFILSSTLDSNQAKSLGGPYKGVGGGISAYGSVYLNHSTVSNNYSSGRFGGIWQSSSHAAAATDYLKILSSTISGNEAKILMGGVYANAGTVQVHNSTIAFNTASKGSLGAGPALQYFSPGLTLSAYSTDISVSLQSSILSNNSYGATASDVSTVYTSSHPVTFSVAPANNLIRSNHASGLPADTLSGSCPLLGALRDNGGPTKTHALLSKSPAIDHGNNVIAETFDQRGQTSDPTPYPYPRVSNNVADIGAYEVNQADIIFNTAFDGCPI